MAVKGPEHTGHFVQPQVAAFCGGDIYSRRKPLFFRLWRAHCSLWLLKGPSTLATLFNHRWPRFVAGIFIPVGNHYFQALASTLQFVAQVCDRLWLVPATDRAFAYITYMSPPHVALVCSGPPQKRGHMWLNKVASVLGPLGMASKGTLLNDFKVFNRIQKG